MGNTREIDVDDTLPIGHIEFVKRCFHLGNAGVGYQDVQASKGARCPFHQTAHRRFIGDIRASEFGSAPTGQYFIDNLGTLLRYRRW